jgi:hypothetical protein
MLAKVRIMRHDARNTGAILTKPQPGPPVPDLREHPPHPPEWALLPISIVSGGPSRAHQPLLDART